MSFLKTLSNSFQKYLNIRNARHCTAIIVAAGSASRMQGTDKIMTALGDKPVLIHTLEAFENASAIHEVIVVTRNDLLAEISALCRSHSFVKVRTVALGGFNRLESVSRGLDHVSKETTHVAIHDGARPLITPAVIDRTVQKAIQTGAAAPALPVKDTIKISRGGMVINTPKRSELYAVQTPQAFDFDLLRAALQKASQQKWDVTDDCSAVERMGMTIHLVEGDEENIKITTPFDLTIAEAILKKRRGDA